MFFGDLCPLNGVVVKIHMPKDRNQFENKYLGKIILFYLLCEK